MHRTRAIRTIGLSALMLLGCISSASAELAKVSGTLTYPKGSVLPPNAVVYINLMDVSPSEDNSGDIIARKTVTNPSQVPIPFEMEYDPARISSNHTYAVLVQIAANHEVIFRNTSAYPVITKGNPSAVEVLVNPVK